MSRAGEAEALIANLRAQIDEVDGTLLALLRRRLALVHAVNFVKRAAGREVFDADRESSLLSRAAHAGAEVGRVYSRIIATCRDIAAEAAVSDSEHGGDSSAPVERPDGS